MRGMRKLLATTFATLCTLAAAGAQDVTHDGVPTPSARPSPAARVAPRRLDLGPYGRPYASSPMAELPTQTPRFRTEVEVHGKARDSATLTARLEWFLQDADLTRGATPATMSAPSIDEMREYRPHPPDAVDFVPIVRWLTERLRR